MRMRHALLLLSLFTLQGCLDRQENAAAYKNPLDMLRVALGLARVGTPVCYRQERLGGVPVYAFIGYDACYRFSSPQHLHGVWLVDEEYSVFLEDRKVAPSVLPMDRDLPWFRLPPQPLPGKGMTKTAPMPQAFAVDLIGRKSLYSGHYGQMGFATHIILADKIIAIQTLPAPRRPQSRR